MPCRDEDPRDTTNSFSVGFRDGFEIPPRRTSGGLSIVWKIGVQCEVGFCNENIVNLVLSSNPTNHQWMVSFVYGPPDWNNKANFWYKLTLAGHEFGGPWLCFDDFNVVMD